MLTGVVVASLAVLPESNAAASVPAGSAPAESTLSALAGATSLGALAGSTSVSILVVLKPRDQAALDNFISGVSTPNSPSYGDYLAPGQFGSRFGATPAVIEAVTGALRADGLNPGAASADDLMIPVTATASQLSRALNVSFTNWRLTSGRVAYLAKGTPSISPAVDADVADISGLEDVAVLQPRSMPTTPAAGTAVACPTAANFALHKHYQPGNQQLTITSIMKAYGAYPLYDVGDLGKGITIDIFEGEQNFPSDITTYEACFGISTPVHYIPVAGGAPKPDAADFDGGESELDIEAIATIAPKSIIDVYQTYPTTTNSLEEYADMINSDNAQVISTSWGECEDLESALNVGSGYGALNAEHEVFEQAAAQGQSIFAAAGDSGSEDCAVLKLPGTTIQPLDPIPLQTVDDPASDPLVTGVGGTNLRLNAAGARASEYVWNNGPAYSKGSEGATGGGASHFWSMPVWQFTTLSEQGSLPSGLEPDVHCPLARSQTSIGLCREVPDVSADGAALTNLVIFWHGHWIGVYGTSAGAPQWAGLITLADACASDWGRKQVGFVNPALYAIAANPTKYAEAFDDVTSGNNDYVTPSLHPEGYAAGKGYDMASGLGAPNAGEGNQGVVDQLCAGAPLG